MIVNWWTEIKVTTEFTGRVSRLPDLMGRMVDGDDSYDYHEE